LKRFQKARPLSGFPLGKSQKAVTKLFGQTIAEFGQSAATLLFYCSTKWKHSSLKEAN